MAKRLIAVAVLVGFILPGCSSNKAQLKTVVLQPSQVATATKREYHKHEDPGVDCAPKRDKSCYDKFDVLPDATGDSPIAVGLWHSYGEADWVVVGCWERINCIYRGLVLFDLTQLGPSPTVVSARLKYHETIFQKSDATNWSADEDCIAKIGFLLSSWGGFALPAEFLVGDISEQGLSGGIEVAPLVRNWADGKIPNNGFLLVGPNEATGKNDNDACVARLDSLRLEVQLNVTGK